MADALSKPDLRIWRMRPRAPMPGAVLGPIDEIEDPGAKEYTFGRGTSVFSMFVIRREDCVYGYLNICPHYSSRLNCNSAHFLNIDGTRIQCSSHFAEFRIEDGFGLDGAAEGCWLDPVPVQIRNGMIVISET